MSEHRDAARNWWQTIPGILTAVAAVISAVAGLIIALNGRPAARSPESTDPPAAQTAAAPAANRPADRTVPGPSTTGLNVVFPDGPEVTLSGGSLLLKVIGTRVESFNPETRLLRLSIRWTNNSNAFVRNYWWTLRLVVDGLPRAPEDPALEQVEAHSAKDLLYAFKVPASGGRVVLAIFNDNGERAELPISLTPR